MDDTVIHTGGHVPKVTIQLLFSLILITAPAMAARAVPGEMIVKFKPNQNMRALETSMNESNFEIVEVLVPELNLYKVKMKNFRMSPALAMRALKANPAVSYAQEDHVVTQRSQRANAFKPNDPEFINVWSLYNSTKLGADTHAAEAWNMGTGGKDFAGNEIVIAVVDGGVDLTHKDLADNIWTNHEEIPGNSIDDDGNGYVDDVYGWNAFNNNGTVPADRHGTHVAGIVGARGNNGIFTSGINWNVKIMGIAGSTDQTSIVAKAYGYVIKQKKLWLETAGKKGANIVVTNSSFGVDQADCTSGTFPLWNDLYEEMGKLGILSATATANNAYDIDVEGDVPTQCASDYIISVTNTTNTDGLYSSAAWGLKNVDLGAPGTNILSSVPGNRVEKLTGTSMATPQVTGAVALLHSLASKHFNELYLFNPAQAAIEMKAMMLSTVDQIPALQGKTVSGGRLNIFSAAEKIRNY